MSMRSVMAHSRSREFGCEHVEKMNAWRLLARPLAVQRVYAIGSARDLPEAKQWLVAIAEVWDVQRCVT
jgi:hypothetical protein